MFKCLDCGHLFEDGEEKLIKESLGEFWGQPTVRVVSVCPICEGDFEEVKPCEICGSYESIESGESVCEKCKIRVLKRFKRFMADNFTDKERQLLNDLMDGEEL